MSDDEPQSPAIQARRKRNIVLAAVLVAFGLLIYLMSLVEWHQHFG